MGKNNFQALQYVRHFVDLAAGYFYGCFGQMAGWDLYNQKKQQFPSQYPPEKWTVESFVKYFGSRVFDCLGLVFKGYQFNVDNNFDSNPVYQSKYDFSADGFFDVCKEKGPIETMPDIPGIIVHKKGHVGMYEGIKNGKKVFMECKGHAYGSIRTTDTKWTEWAKCPFWVYITIDSWITDLYCNILDRKPDKDGLDYWSGQLNKKEKTPTEVAKFFLTSPEFLNRNLSDEAFLAILYQVFFDRTPDRDGYTFWLKELKNGKSRESVIDGFVGSREWKDMNDYLLYIINAKGR